jgi:hypothetical protein
VQEVLVLPLPVHCGPQFLHADVEPASNRPHGRPGWSNLAALNPTVGPKRQIRRRG